MENRKEKVEKLKKKHQNRLKKELKVIPPREFISFDVLKGHLPILICGGPIGEKKVDKLMDLIALELIEVYAEQIKARLRR